MFFFGTFNYHLDDKSRCSIPARFREKLGQVVYVTKGFDHCLYLFPEETFIEMAKKNAMLDELSPQERQYRRTFFASSMDYSIDKAGRITLTKEHLMKAGIKKDVVLVGNNDHIEIWDRETYENIDLLQDNNYELNAQIIAENRRRGE